MSEALNELLFIKENDLVKIVTRKLEVHFQSQIGWPDGFGLVCMHAHTGSVSPRGRAGPAAALTPSLRPHWLFRSEGLRCSPGKLPCAAPFTYLSCLPTKFLWPVFMASSGPQESRLLGMVTVCSDVEKEAGPGAPVCPHLALFPGASWLRVCHLPRAEEEDDQGMQWES